MDVNQSDLGSSFTDTTAAPPIVAATPNDRIWALCCHLGTLATFFPFANIIIPLAIWLINKDKSPFVNDQGKEALNFQITMMIGYAICAALVFVLIGFPLIIALLLYHIIYSIVAAIKANEGIAYRYPWAIRLIT